ncbi:DUF6350 family protein [Pseudactinotalea sp. HY158]|uniref:cell division protein PerM n=1 Tax=Pseudactinotalea sp. HY158 TaxID=2654547 RepID=UPI00129C7D39|nr:DUF6350 family protein [Pseudactinotalea sp. HY158]QGH70346.1 hypothetical protein GCE65_13230 [Pseudactinotalea sp. HY158]
MTDTSTRRVVDHDPAGPDSRLRALLPQLWLRGVLGGAEAALGSWLAIVVPAVATYVATAASPELGSASWIEAARAGTGLWLLGHGATITLAAGAVSIVPVGVTLLAVLLTSASLRRARLDSWGAVGFAVVTYAVLTALLAQLASLDGVWTALLGGVGVPAAGAVLGMRGRYPRLAWLARLWGGFGVVPRLALRGGVLAALALTAVATIATLASVVAGLDLITALHESLRTDPISTAVTVLVDLLLLPTLIVWATAFLLGPGFAAGADTLFAPGEVVSGPLPALPILGALPDPDSMVATLPILGLAGLLVGLLGGLWLHRRTRELPLWQVWLVAALAALVAATLLAAVQGLSAGAAGPGRMSHWGASAVAVGLAAWWQLGAGIAVLGTVLHPATAAGVRAAAGWLRMWWRQVRGTPVAD